MTDPSKAGGRPSYDLSPLAPGRCACQHGTTTMPNGRRAYVIKPCRMDCEFYVYAQRETQRQGKPIQFRYIPDDAGRAKA